jgi:hypothetical protein
MLNILSSFAKQRLGIRRYNQTTPAVEDKSAIECSFNPSYWFEDMGSDVSGANSSILEEDFAVWTGPKVYTFNADTFPTAAHLPYSAITDNTEGIAAFHDILFTDGSIVGDFGGGASDGPFVYMKNTYPQMKFFVLDPIHRDYNSNVLNQRHIMQSGGVDFATAMSVLNVIPSVSGRKRLIVMMYHAMKENALAYFKVWAGFWPSRGSGIADVDSNQNVFQANKWANDFLPEVSLVFGSSNCFADNNMNLIVARKVSK